jgi:hypothetical protein
MHTCGSCPRASKAVWQFERKAAAIGFRRIWRQTFQKIGGTVGEPSKDSPRRRSTARASSCRMAQDGATTRLVGQVDGNRIDAQVHPRRRDDRLRGQAPVNA